VVSAFGSGTPTRPTQPEGRCNPPSRNLNCQGEFRVEQAGGHLMAWTTPTLVEICIGLEINGYLPAEF
jgi:coenzyme PQQ precursor peptide PqqA